MTREEKLNLWTLWNSVKDETVFPADNEFDMTPDEIRECFDKLFSSLIQ